jgi:hypothetical protein
MIRFFDEQGNVFDGSSPYIHWIEGQLSVGLWYSLRLLVISDTPTISTSQLDENSIFKFIDPQYYSSLNPELDLNDISVTQITNTGSQMTISEHTWYIHQILMVCSSTVPGEYIDNFSIYSGDSVTDVKVGVDIYEEDETLSINLGNKGLEIPNSIRKAFLDNDMNEALEDYALLNRKFKELVSNYIDIVDNKGSYKSLFNSLKWFEWGEGAKLFEVWKNDSSFLEKELGPVLSNKYSNLLVTHQKTTHLSLIAALQKMSDEEIDIERNPVLEDISYQWSTEELALKVSILGAFFERYFMPIHLDLKRACVETLICTNQIKGLNGLDNYSYGFVDDYKPIDIKMEHTIALGNIPMVAVGKDTMFGRKIDHYDYSGDIYYMDPIGVESLDSIKEVWDLYNHPLGRDYNLDFNRDFGPRANPPEYYYPKYNSESGYSKNQRVLYSSNYHSPSRDYNLDFNHDFGPRANSTYDNTNTYKAKQTISAPAGDWDPNKWVMDNEMNDGIAGVFIQLKGGVGSVVPVEVSVELPDDDALTTEIITVYRHEGDTKVLKGQVIEHRLIRPVEGKASFTFNLVSTDEEKISFSLALYSATGHCWTGASSYETVDVSGSFLKVCSVRNTNNGPSSGNVVYCNILDWINQYQDPHSTDLKNPYASLYPYFEGDWEQWERLPLKDLALIQYIPTDDDSQLQLNQLIVIENVLSGSTYNISWIDNAINSNYWVIYRAGEMEGVETSEANPRYVMLINKTPGKLYANKDQVVTAMRRYGITRERIKRLDMIYIPQLHLYTSLEDLPATIESYTFSQTDLLCVIPQFKKNLKIEPVSWEYQNKTTLENIIVNKPVIKPLIADKKRRALSPGYWTVTMRYKLAGSSEIHTLTKNSAFKIVKEKDD